MQKQIVQFKHFSPATYEKKYPNGVSGIVAARTLPNVPKAQLQPGEVKIPGYDWHACILFKSKPFIFYTNDNGWQDVPVGPTFQEI